MLRIPADSLMFVSSDGNYSNITTEDGRTKLVTIQLGQIEDILQEQLSDAESNFLRLGRSLIINTNYIYFIDISKQEVGTTKDYSVSLVTASTGTVKAMLLTDNLVPLF